jgi:hypothetical protein
MPKKKRDLLSPKKIIYVLLTILLGKLLGLLAYALLSMKFIKMLVKRGLPVEYDHIYWFIYSPLPAYLFYVLVITGAISGFFLGLRWWKMVYVEKRHWKKCWR